MDMLDKTHVNALLDETLQPRHFDVLGLSLRQFHLWLKQTGFEKKEKRDGKWRLFSPVELLALSTLKTLKAETDLSLSKHPEFIEFLGNSEEFAFKVINEWVEGKQPLLITDLRQMNKVRSEAHARSSSHKVNQISNLPEAILTLSMPLDKQIQIIFGAIKIGGTDRQRMTVEQLVELRAKTISKLENPNTKAKINQSIGVHRRGKRKIDIEGK